MKVLITGANGFIGRALCTYFAERNIQTVPVVRKRCDLTNFVVLSNSDEQGWHQALKDCDAVVHLAGQSELKKIDQTTLNELRQNNVEIALAMCHRAIEAGVQRFIFVSSAKVHGEQSPEGGYFTPDSSFMPLDPYAASKVEAEQQLQNLVRNSSIELVIIRPPLVYGPGVKGNFASMVKWVLKGVPLPFSGIKNLRSMVAIENLCSFITLCCDRSCSPKAANEIFMISDGKPVSIADLLRQIAVTHQKKQKIFYMPVSLIKLCLILIGKTSITNRLLGSFVLDDSKCQTLLGWIPPISMNEQLQRMNFVKNS